MLSDSGHYLILSSPFFGVNQCSAPRPNTMSHLLYWCSPQFLMSLVIETSDYHMKTQVEVGYQIEGFCLWARSSMGPHKVNLKHLQYPGRRNFLYFIIMARVGKWSIFSLMLESTTTNLMPCLFGVFHTLRGLSKPQTTSNIISNYWCSLKCPMSLNITLGATNTSSSE